jgi:hypothetical protein
MVDLLNPVRRHEHLPSGNGRQETGYRRILIVAEPHDQIVDPAQLRPRTVAKLPPDYQRKMQDTRTGSERAAHLLHDTTRTVATALWLRARPEPEAD